MHALITSSEEDGSHDLTPGVQRSPAVPEGKPLDLEKLTPGHCDQSKG